jgi:hypothetical protein
MSIAVLKLSNKPVPFVVEKSESIVTAMTGNANYTTPSPSLATITTKTTALGTAFQNAINGGKNLKALVKIARKDLLLNLALLMYYVQHESGGDEVKILSSGFGVKSPRSPVGVLPAPQNVRVAYNGNSGEAVVRWNGVPKRRSYIVQMSVDPIGVDTWENVPEGETGKISFPVTGLEPGKTYWFRVITYSTGGFSAPSDPAKIMAV